MILRLYQKDCIDKILWARNAKLDGNELVVLPTGSGKSVIIAHLADAINEPILILQPTKEILEQNYNKLSQYVDKSRIGIYSASMNEKEVNFFTLATIQSIYEKPEYFSHFKLVIIDEAHLVNPKSLGGMFMSFLKKIGNPKVIGMTATPYRMDSMYLGWGTNEVRVVTTIKLVNRMKGFFWSRILFNINTEELMAQGFLCPLEYVDYSVIEHAQIPTNKSRSDFDLDKFEKIMTERQQRVLDAVNYGRSVSKSVLAFCSSVRQATKFADTLENSAVVSAKTNKKDREKIISDFKNGIIQTVFNVGVLTTGFDFPSLDCIVMIRPTRSIALYYQMIGRGMRNAEGKTSCKIIDLTSNVKSLGKAETIKLVKRDKWELESQVVNPETGESCTASWHGAELYSFVIEAPNYKKGNVQPQISVERILTPAEIEASQNINLEDVPF